MNKGLAIALGMVMFALAGAASYAKAPILGGVPDIVISDREDNALTLDNNWFRYPNAFDPRDHTTDIDSPATDWIYAFVEQTSANDIGIVLESDGDRLVTQINAADREDPSAWGTNEMTNLGGTRDYLLSFVDLVRSAPGSETGDGVNTALFPAPAGTGDDITAPVTLDLPWHNTEGSPTLSGTSRDVYIYVADDPLATGADRVGYDIMTVISRNYGTDSLAGGATSFFEETFATGAGTQWSYSNATAIGLPAATSGQGSASGETNGYVALTAGLDATTFTNDFRDQFHGRWKTVNQTQPFEGVVDYITPAPGQTLVYVARFVLSHDAADVEAVPQMRLGAEHAMSLTWIESYVASVVGGGVAGNPHIPAQDTPKTYKVIWSAQEGAPAFSETDPAQNVALGGIDARTYNLFFDILDPVATQAGTWTLRNVQVGTVPRPADQTPGANFTDFQTSAGWSLLSGTGGITRTYPGGALQYNDPGNPSGTAVNLFNNNLYGRITGLDWTGGTVLRGTVELSCPTAANRTNFHHFRLVEMISPFSQLATELNIVGYIGGVIGQMPGQPFSPPAAPATAMYEAYFPAQIDDDALLDPLRALGDYDNILARVDALNTGGNGTSWQNATAFTVHSLAYEVLTDSF